MSPRKQKSSRKTAPPKIAAPVLTDARVKALLNRFRRRRILVFGDVGVDQYTVGKVNRISPEAPIPVVEVSSVSHKLGLAANVADNVSALQGTPILVGLLGKDNGARVFRTLLSERAISGRHLVEESSRPTTLKERVVAESQQVVRIDYERKGAPKARATAAVERALKNAVAKADCIIIEDYAKGLVTAAFCEILISEATRRGVPVLVDPNAKSVLKHFRGCTLVTPNTSEAEALTGLTIDSDAKLQEAGKRLLQELASPHVIITRGKEGMAIFSRGSAEPVVIPTFAREVFDVSGAGDTVIATLALGLVAGATVVEAALLANAAAGVEVSKRGTATVSQVELREYIRALRGGGAAGFRR